MKISTKQADGSFESVTTVTVGQTVTMTLDITKEVEVTSLFELVLIYQNDVLTSSNSVSPSKNAKYIRGLQKPRLRRCLLCSIITVPMMNSKEL